MRYRYLGALTAALITLGLVLGAYTVTPALRRAVGAQDALIFRNFHQLETAGSFTYRWSKGDGSATAPLATNPEIVAPVGTSAITLSQVGQPRQGLLSMTLWMPAEQPATPLTISAGQQPLLTLSLSGRRTVELLVPQQALAGGEPRFALSSPTWSPPNDPRPLGVGIESLHWRGAGWTLPPVRQLWALPGLALALALLLQRLGRSTGVATLIGVVVGGGLALAAALRPLEVAPFTHRLLLMVLLAHAALLLWTALYPDGSRAEPERWWTLPTRVGPVPLLILLGIGYWMLLLYQRALCAETVTSVCPRPGTQIIGSIALLALLGLAALLALQPRLRLARGWQLALIVLALSGVAEAGYAATFAFRRSGPDFFILWRAAYDFNLGRSLYKIDDVLANHFGHVFKVPPFYGMLFLPIAEATDPEYNLALAAHRGLNIVLYLTTGGLLAALLRREGLRRWGWPVALGAVGVIMGLMQPPFDTIAYGQIDIMLLLLLTAALLGLRGQRSWLVGLAIALGALFKLYPLVLLGFLFVRREWRAIGWTGAWLVLLNGIAVGLMGWQNHVVYVTQVLPNIGGGTSWVENQTINGFLSRLLTGTMQTDPVRDPLINLVTYACFGLVAGVSLLLALVRSERQSSLFALQFSLFAVVMVLAVPAAWMHYATITILTLVALVWYAADQPLPLGKAALIALAFALIAYGNQWSFFNGTRNPGLPALALSYKFYGLLVLWSLVVTLLWQAWTLRRAAARPQTSGPLVAEPLS